MQAHTKHSASTQDNRPMTFTIGSIRSIVFAVIGLTSLVLTACDGNTGNENKPDENTSKLAAIAAVNPSDAKSFFGSDTPTLDGSLSTIDLPQSKGERNFMADFGCVDEIECYGPRKFDAYILKKYPDIKKIKFTQSEQEKETMEYERQVFHRSLYFAKEIELANGQSLFDFLTKCSKNVSNLSRAETIWGPITHLQYFPVLRKNDTGEEFELQILFIREGAKITAESLLFSSAILREKDFMNMHNVSCWLPQKRRK